MSAASQWDPSLLDELLPIYYKKLFPFSHYYKWLRYKDSGPSYFKNREFSFTLKDDIYLRYRSYSDQAELEKDLRTRCPHKIDIGAVFTCSPKLREMVRAGEFVAQYKELVFDIDMTDYDDVRVCCSGADICLKCWPLMTMAIKVLNRALTEDFGFKSLLWVYSGRRGVHCWVCDEKARKLSTTARAAIADYLSVVRGGANMKKKVILKYKNNHPSIERAIEIIAGYFDNYIIKQDLLATQEQYDTVKELLNSDIREELASCEERVKGPTDSTMLRWGLIKKCFVSSMSSPPNTVCLDSDLASMPNNMKEIMLQYAYPRLDVNVSKGLNHLLKSPFCIHPKTGRVCVPIDLKEVDKFNPFKVPTLQQLTDELGEWSGDANLLAYKKTSLRPYIETFDKFINGLIGEANLKSTTAADTEKAAVEAMDIK